MCAELDQIQRLGWRGSVFMADNKFICACAGFHFDFPKPRVPEPVDTCVSCPIEQA
jgi:hypothetical protein